MIGDPVPVGVTGIDGIGPDLHGVGDPVVVAVLVQGVQDPVPVTVLRIGRVGTDLIPVGDAVSVRVRVEGIGPQPHLLLVGQPVAVGVAVGSVVIVRIEVVDQAVAVEIAAPLGRVALPVPIGVGVQPVRPAVPIGVGAAMNRGVLPLHQSGDAVPVVVRIHSVDQTVPVRIRRMQHVRADLHAVGEAIPVRVRRARVGADDQLHPVGKTVQVRVRTGGIPVDGVGIRGGRRQQAHPGGLIRVREVHADGARAGAGTRPEGDGRGRGEPGGHHVGPGQGDVEEVIRGPVERSGRQKHAAVAPGVRVERIGDQERLRGVGGVAHVGGRGVPGELDDVGDAVHHERVFITVQVAVRVHEDAPAIWPQVARGGLQRRDVQAQPDEEVRPVEVEIKRRACGVTDDLPAIPLAVGEGVTYPLAVLRQGQPFGVGGKDLGRRPAGDDRQPGQEKKPQKPGAHPGGPDVIQQVMIGLHVIHPWPFPCEGS